MAVSGSIEVPQLDEQIRRCNAFDRVAQKEYTAAMRAALALGVENILPLTPTASGELRASVSSAIKYTSGENVRGVMTAGTVAANGFPYGYALDASSKYRYAGTRKRTKGWLKGVIKRKRGEFTALFAAATGRIIQRLEVNNG